MYTFENTTATSLHVTVRNSLFYVHKFFTACGMVTIDFDAVLVYVPSDDRIEREFEALPFVPVCCGEVAPRVERSLGNRTELR